MPQSPPGDGILGPAALVFLAYAVLTAGVWVPKVWPYVLGAKNALGLVLEGLSWPIRKLLRGRHVEAWLRTPDGRRALCKAASGHADEHRRDSRVDVALGMPVVFEIVGPGSRETFDELRARDPEAQELLRFARGEAPNGS